MLKQHLQQKLQQKLSPQQIQLIKLLEVPAIELEDRIKKEMEENPALEEGKELNDYDTDTDLNNEDSSGGEDEVFSEDFFGEDDDTPDYKLHANNYSAENEREQVPVSIGISFHEHLTDQLGLQQLSEDDMFLAEYIIGNIDDDGYLQRSPEEICDDILFQTGRQYETDQVVAMLEIIQDFDPPGVGARDLQECLILQLKRKEQSHVILLAENILKNFFDEFSKKHYEKIIRKLEVDEEDFKLAISEITKLNPKPGNAWENLWERNMDQITPDFILENINGELVLSLNNGNLPDLHVNRTYANMLKEFSESKNPTKESRDAILFVKQKVESAKWFIDAVKQRQTTLLTTMRAIIQYQKPYFMTGDDAQLKPMIMKDIAEMTGYDISTISRVSNSKYIETDFGIFALKHFFTEAGQTESGEEISTREIKNILSGCIAEEDKKHPLTDDALSALLKEKGFLLARRTVAKYREQLNIPVARLRKEI